ncbi:heavy-metal-associated domain-containing protein [Hymenobacter arizonensis]|uniref:Copper chaperone CopZ n=1 Tax=Hymenobacter arizonensis TaxID=1227077 RepID=A0A1I5Z521_HYMAR|nr:heavy-metal-associated domain-containing protein [Hymenobacter arizonensis]SFQ51562.1 Copper chaperone CopZ [Hymenobacter arizonensis]
MSTLRFKTTINCGNCIRAVTPTLNQEVGANNWQVDTASPDKVLTITADQVSASQVMEAVEAAGFEIQPLAQ